MFLPVALEPTEYMTMRQLRRWSFKANGSYPAPRQMKRRVERAHVMGMRPNARKRDRLLFKTRWRDS